MTTPKHSPLPWTLGDHPHLIFDAGGEAIMAGSDSEENAAFIVGACNAHYTLVLALKKIEEHLEHLPADRACFCQDVIRAALKKAEGK